MRECGTCKHFNEIAQATDRKTGKPRVADNLGRCAERSIFPAGDPDAGPYPPGVKRARPGELGNVVVVRREEIVPGCPHYVKRPDAK